MRWPKLGCWERAPFDKPIGSYQALQHPLAYAKAHLEDVMIEIVSIFSFDTTKKPLEEWERYYTEEYIHQLKTLPGLRRYLIGKTLPAPGANTDFARVAVLYFDDMAAFAQAFATPLGHELSQKMTEMAPHAKLYIVEAQEVL